jgi:DtxR family manganese transport transcriptional regulator
VAYLLMARLHDCDFASFRVTARRFAINTPERPVSLGRLVGRASGIGRNLGGANQMAARSPVAGGGMPEEPTQAARFGKARTARSLSQLEDYVELIADLLATQGEARATDVAKRLGVAHPTAIKTIGRLKREGLVTARPYRGIFLTEAGHELASRVRTRHRLMVELLLAVGVPREAAEADAEGMEHHVSDTALEAFEHFLSHRKRRRATATCSSPGVVG